MALNSGDIGFVAYNADGPSFAFVALVEITANESIHFTDRGWLSDNSGFFNTTNDSTLTWTSPTGGVTAGTVVTISGSTASSGTIDSNLFSLSTSGDQILAYQGDVDTPSTFLAAINNNNHFGTNIWTGDADSEHVSNLPEGLTHGSTALSIDEIDNVAYDGPTTGTRETLLAELNDHTNWTLRSDSTSQSGAASFTVNSSDDTDAPIPTNLTPGNNALDVQIADDLVIVFDELIQLGSGNIRIKNNSTNELVEEIDIFSNQVSLSNQTLTVNPSVDLAYGTTYHIEIDSTAIADLAGNFYAGISNPAIWNFTTAAASDTTAPTSPALSPSDDSTNVGLNDNLVLTFAETVQTSTGNITIYDANGIVETIDVATAQVTVNNDTVTINPSVSLEYETDYYVQIDSGSIQDLAGNDYSGIADSATWNFSTEAAPDVTAPTVSIYSPTLDATQIAAGADLVLTFDEAIQVGTGDITIHKVSDNSVVATISVGDSSQVSISGAVMTINPTADLDDETAYYVQIASGVITDLSSNSFAGLSGPAAWSFTTADVSAPTFTIDTPIDGATQVTVDTSLSLTFNEPIQKGTGDILIKNGLDNSIIATIPVADAQVSVNSDTVTINPTSALSDQTSVYIEIPGSAFTDSAGNPFAGITGTDTWNFITEDNTIPTLITLNPVDDGTSVAVGANLSLTFDEDIQKGMGDILIKKVGDDSVAATIPVGDAQVSVSGAIVTIAPTSSLDEDTDYYVEIPNTAFTDLEGNAFAGLLGNTVWNFTTADNTAPGVNSFSPADDGMAIALNTNLSITFSEAVEANVGNILLKKSNGNELVETIDVTSGAVTINGATVTIDPTMDLEGETDYYLEIPNDAFRDLADNAYGGTVDATTWNFTTPDVAAPTLAAVSPLSPADDTTGVSIDSNFSLTLSEDIQKGTGNIVIKAMADNAVVETIDVTSGAVTVNGATVTIDPTANLAYETGYYIEIDDGALLDLANNPYAGISGNSTWNVTTENDSGITTTPLNGSLTEGAIDIYTIALDTAPTSTVTIELTADIQTEISVDGGSTFANSLSINLTNTTPQTIAVKALDDADMEASSHSGIISHSITSSTDPNYSVALAIPSVTVDITDNDMAPVGPTVFISEYVEGSSDNKAIELYNPTGSPVDLTTDDYTIEIYSNGSLTPANTIQLSGTIASGEVFVVADDAANTSITDVQDQSNGGTFFNGNDAIALYKDGILIDSFGQRGFDPGDAWISGAISTKDQTLRRKSTVTSGDTNTLDVFDPALEWDSFPIDNVDRLGSHNDAAPQVSTISPSDAATDIALASDIAITFDEAVDATDAWFALSGSTSGAITALVNGSGTSYTLNPSTDFAPGETVTVTLNAAQITDQDGIADLLDGNGDDTAGDNFTFSFVAGGITPIHEIQGNGSASPEDGNVHTIEGIVTYVKSDGFFVQEEDSDADGDDTTSESIFVFSNETVTVGDRVQVTGTVEEDDNLTRLAGVSAVTIQSSNNALPTALSVNLPLTSTNALEPYEGMRIVLPQSLTVTDVYDLGRGGLIEVASGGPLETPTNTMMPGGDAAYQEMDLHLNRLIIDDGSDTPNPDPISYPGAGLSATNTLRVGDTATGITGIISEAWSGWSDTDAYRVFPTEAPTFAANNLRPVAPDDVGGSLTVATFNLGNFFNGDGVGGGFPTSRGADSFAEALQQGEKLVAAIAALDADVLALQELENDYGDGSNSAIASLVLALNSVMGAGTYTYVEPSTATVGDDEIAVGVIFKPDAVSIVAGTTVEILDDAELSGLGLNGLGNVFDGVNTNRAPLAVTFEENNSGEQFTVAVSHLKSKSDSGLIDSSDPNYDQNDGQSFWNQMRVNGVTALNEWLATNPTGTDDPDVLILGDLNSYAQEDPITALETAGYTNHSTDYTYVYEGQRGTLDYALSSASLAAQVTGSTAWHINADEPLVLGYDQDYKSAGQLLSLYNADPYRSSDHDPVLIGLSLVSPSPTPSPTPTPPSTPTPTPIPTPTPATPPSQPPQPQLKSGFDKGISSSDGLTNQNKPELSGTAEPNSILNLFANGQSLGTTTVNANGQWSFVPPQALADGTYTLTAVVTVNGQTSTVSVGTSLTIDTQPSQVSIPAITPNVRDTALDQVQIQFTEAIANFDINDLKLTRNGVDVPLTGVTLTQLQSLDWVLSNLDAVTTEAGVYQLMVVPNDITDAAGNSITQVVQSWETGRVAAVLDILSDTAGNGNGNGRPTKQFKGTLGNDRLVGTRGKDIMRGGKGNDVLIAGKGDDGNGRDELFGEAGNDLLKGGNGRDFLSGGAGRDRLKGGKNIDELLGGNGNDTLIGGRGHDFLTGGKGKDKIKGGGGQDTIIFNSLKEGVDIVKGFELTEDLIDLRGIFSGDRYPADSTFDQFKKYVSLVQVGNATEVQVALDETATEFTSLAKLRGIQAEALGAQNFILQ
ncbi:MAG: ExeM/NucH family extracellular endonuclease [Cyanobacteria bacterium P01_F01_bin.150]